MKKLFILLLASAFVFASCSNGNSKPDEPVPEPRIEVTGKLGKYGSPYEVSDIVFNDGSATPYTAQLTLTDEQKAAAIAVIFYKGKGLNNGNDKTTSRTLGVGLKHGGSIAWCTSSANAYGKKITTILCTASGNTGAYTFNGDKNGSDNLEQIEAFEGVDDTATAANYPAFYFAKQYNEQKIGSETVSRIAGTSYETGWYLPSLAELYQIYTNGIRTNQVFDIDAASILCGGDQFGTKWYWSSSQYDSSSNANEINTVNFSSGGIPKYYKSNNEGHVCTIREFN